MAFADAQMASAVLAMNYVLHIVVLIGIYGVLAAALNLLAGYTGLLSICQAAFFGLGAYSTALLSLRGNMSWTLTVCVGMVASGAVAAVLGAATLRLRGDYFVIATFAFQVVLHSVIQNWVEITQGPLGLPGIPRPDILGLRIASPWAFVVLSLGLAALALFFVWRLIEAPYGRVLGAVREDETLAKSVGKNVAVYKISVVVIGAVMASAAGSLYASYFSYIDPSSFTVNESILILSVVIVGGVGTRWGPVIGAGVLVILPEALRFIGISSSIAANLRQVIYGALLVLIVMFRPRGVSRKYGFGR